MRTDLFNASKHHEILQESRRLAKVVATDLSLVCKVLVVKGADQRPRISELETVTLLHCSVRPNDLKY